MSSKRPPKNDYTRLKRLLEEQERFPLQYVHKFIGRNEPAFLSSVAELETRFPSLKRQSARHSKGGKHLALTYAFLAPDADAVVELLRATEGLEDLLVIL